MQRRRAVLLSGVFSVLVGTIAPSATATRYESFDAPKHIAKTGTTISTLDVDDVGPIGDLNVAIDIAFLWDEHLNVCLVAPDGTRVELLSGVGGSGMDFTGTVLDDEAPTSIRDGEAPFTGRYQPEGSLADLTGRQRQGLWQLEIANDSGLFGGTLSSWALVIAAEDEDTCPPPPEPTAPEPGDGAINVSVDTTLAWGIGAGGQTAFRFLVATGEEGPDPFSLYELNIDPPGSVRIDDNCGVYALDFSPDGELYGCSEFALWRLQLINDTVACTKVGDFRSATDDSVLMTGLAFHPDGVLYGSTFDLVTNSSVIYRIDKATAYVTEVCRIPIWNGIAWAIDFSPNGQLYAAFMTLLLIDLNTCKETLLGDVLATDLDWAPDGFLYAVDEEARKLYAIDPSLGIVVSEVGPYDIRPWGLASQVLVAPSSNDTRTSPMMNGAGPHPDARGRRALKAELLSRITAARSPGRGVAVRASAEDPNRVTFDVFLDTKDPPGTRVCGETESQVCDPGGLEVCTTYFWQVIAKNACGRTAAGPVWSFRTESVPADFDEDCDVDFSDLAVFASHWLTVSD
jgi:subtilisin-like proprotein convertase family protein